MFIKKIRNNLNIHHQENGMITVAYSHMVTSHSNENKRTRAPHMDMVNLTKKEMHVSEGPIHFTIYIYFKNIFFI